MSLFAPATKQSLKARVALEGPTGSGKTWTMLEWLTVLADGGRIAVVDTEHGSASLYADTYTFDVLTWPPPYDPAKLTETIKAAQREGYAALGVDSMSHFWEGEGGVLDIVDAAAARQHGNSYTAWKTGTPVLRHLIDTILSSQLHVVATMRSKMEYVLDEDDRGKKVPRKVGMAPVMRAGVEYEFTVVGELDLEHRLTISKSRCSLLADRVVQPGRAGEAADEFLGWLSDGEPPPPTADPDDVADLVEAMNRPATQHARAQIKQEFVAFFGRPDDLLAKDLERAQAWVKARLEDDDGPDDDGSGSDGSGGGEAPTGDGGGAAPDADTSPPPATSPAPAGDAPDKGDAGDPEGGDARTEEDTVGTAEPGPTPVGSGQVAEEDLDTVPVARAQLNRMFGLVGKIWPDVETGGRDVWRHRTSKACGFDVTSWRDLTGGQADVVEDLLGRLADGSWELHLNASGDWIARRKAGAGTGEAA